jgi:cysteinyl-tRNA synthetase
MPRCLAVLWGLIKEPRVGAAAKLDVLRRMDRILAIGIEEAGSRSTELAPELRDLIEQRSSARTQRDFATADRIRDELATRGILLEDRPDGVRWRHTNGKSSPKL